MLVWTSSDFTFPKFKRKFKKTPILYLRKQVETWSTSVALCGRGAAHNSSVLSKKNCKYLCVYNLNLLICILLQCKNVYDCTYTDAYFFC